MLKYIAIGVIVIALLISLYSDIRYRKIFNKVTFPVFITGFFVSGYLSWKIGGWSGLAIWLIALVLGGVSGWVFEKGVIWASGDTKLFLACLTWLCVFIHPLIAVVSLVGAILIFHFALNVMVRLMKPYVIGIPWLSRLIPQSQYPGAITIALAVLLVVII